jgi:hypothetical protein
MFPGHCNSGFHVVGQDDKLRRPTVIVGAEADYVALATVGAGKLARKRGEPKRLFKFRVKGWNLNVLAAKLFQPLMRPALDLAGFYRELCSPSYCSAPQTWQTDAHRLMRDRHRRQILNRLRHHKNEDASAVKTKRMTFWSIASRLFHARSQVLMG